MDVRHRTTDHVVSISSSPSSGGYRNNGTSSSGVVRSSHVIKTPHKHGKYNATAIVLKCLFILFIVAAIATYVFYQSMEDRLKGTKAGAAASWAESAITGKINNNDDTKDTVDKKLYETLQEQNRQLNYQLEELKEKNGNIDGVVNKNLRQRQIISSEDDVEKLHETITHLKQKTNALHVAIKDISKRQLIEKYGEGPHYVEILLSYDPESNVANPDKKKGHDTDSLLIELAPVNEMPATVLHFLEQVNQKLLDGCSFHRNAGHVVQGGPAPNFETIGPDETRKRFRLSGLSNVPFQEYSPNFPHKKYTLGYAGRPGGPDFYVSTRDNTKNHGPGGQTSYEDVGEADPCFAKVVPGFEHVVDRMHKSEVEDGAYKHMKHNIAIRHARLLTEKQYQRLLNPDDEDNGDDDEEIRDGEEEEDQGGEEEEDQDEEDLGGDSMDNHNDDKPISEE